jgi:hypothetical protein
MTSTFTGFPGKALQSGQGPVSSGNLSLFTTGPGSFTHDGFVKKDEAYEQTRGNWDYFLDSLKSYLETGKGTPGLPRFV